MHSSSNLKFIYFKENAIFLYFLKIVSIFFIFSKENTIFPNFSHLIFNFTFFSRKINLHLIPTFSFEPRPSLNYYNSITSPEDKEKKTSLTSVPAGIQSQDPTWVIPRSCSYREQQIFLVLYVNLFNLQHYNNFVYSQRFICGREPDN